MYLSATVNRGDEHEESAEFPAFEMSRLAYYQANEPTTPAEREIARIIAEAMDEVFTRFAGSPNLAGCCRPEGSE